MDYSHWPVASKCVVFLALELVAGAAACNSARLSPEGSHKNLESPSNMIANPSAETANGDNPALPANWRTGVWGSNTTTFSYDSADANTGQRSLKVQMSARSTGDAKWVFDWVPVSAGSVLIYRDYYKSDVPTHLVAAYQRVGGALSYATLASVPAKPTWSAVAVALTVPANVVQVAVYHLIAAVGTLQIDDVSMALPQTADTSSGVPNGSMEQTSDLDPNLPLAWRTGGWGTNKPVFAYASTGRTGNRGLSVTLSSYKNGDAKWYFDPQPVTAGHPYEYSDYYVADAPSFLTARFTMGDGTFSYISAGQVPAAESYTQAKATFVVPFAATALTVFHGLARDGTLQIDDAALVDTSLGVAAPTQSPAPGTYASDVAVSLTCATSGAEIHYTLDGSEPSAASPVYTTPLLVVGPSTTTTIKAIAVKASMPSSAVTTGTYEVRYLPVAAPVLSPEPGSYAVDQSVVITTATTGAVVHYTTDGSDPTTSSPIYTTPVAVVGPNTTMTINARAFKDQMLDSPITGGTYVVIYSPVPAWPRAKVVFTFDVVGRDPVLGRALPILASHGMPAVVYAETALMNSGESWVMSWQELQDLQNTYGWEIGSHTINHPYLTKVSASQLEIELRDSLADLVAHGLNVKSFATPYGDSNLKVVAAAARHYESHRLAWGGPNIWPEAYNDYQLRCLEVDKQEDATPTVADVQQWIDDAIAGDQTLVLLLHDIVPGVPQMYEFNEADFGAVVDYVATRPIEVTTMTSALRYSTNPNLLGNPSFAVASAGWAADWQRNDSVNVTLDANSHGCVPEVEHSVKIVGGASRRELTSGAVPVSSDGKYMVRFYSNAQSLSAGGWNVWIEERDISDVYVGGQWLGGTWSSFVGNQYYTYQPSSASVARVQIKLYTDVNSELTLYVDAFELRRMD